MPRSWTIVCPECLVPFTRYGAAQSSTWYRDNGDVCICCREGLDPETLQPTDVLTRSVRLDVSRDFSIHAPADKASVSS